jgi:hypothetical protein
MDVVGPSNLTRVYRLQAGDGDVLRRGRWTLDNTAARKQNVAVARLIRTSRAAEPT